MDYFKFMPKGFKEYPMDPSNIPQKSPKVYSMDPSTFPPKTYPFKANCSKCQKALKKLMSRLKGCYTIEVEGKIGTITIKSAADQQEMNNALKLVKDNCKCYTNYNYNYNHTEESSQKGCVNDNCNKENPSKHKKDDSSSHLFAEHGVTCNYNYNYIHNYPVVQQTNNDGDNNDNNKVPPKVDDNNNVLPNVNPFNIVPPKIDPFNNVPPKVSPFNNVPSKVNPFNIVPPKVDPFNIEPPKVDSFNSLPPKVDHVDKSNDTDTKCEIVGDQNLPQYIKVMMLIGVNVIFLLLIVIFVRGS